MARQIARCSPGKRLPFDCRVAVVLSGRLQLTHYSENVPSVADEYHEVQERSK